MAGIRDDQKAWAFGSGKDTSWFPLKLEMNGNIFLDNVSKTCSHYPPAGQTKGDGVFPWRGFVMIKKSKAAHIIHLRGGPKAMTPFSGGDS